MEFKGGIVASVSTGIDVTLENVVRIFGSKGSIFLPDPWLCRRTGRQDGRIVVTSGSAKPEEIELPFEHTSYALEADVCGEAIRAGLVQPVHPTAMTWDDTLGNMRVIDAWRA
jgi:predicted dehydrogenase